MELEQDVRIQMSRQEIKLHDRLYIAAVGQMAAYVDDDNAGDEYMRRMCECARKWADMAVKVKK